MDAKRIFSRERLLTVDQVRRRLNCSSRHVYYLLDRGESGGGLPSYRVGEQRGLRVPEDALEKYLRRCKVDPGS